MTANIKTDLVYATSVRCRKQLAKQEFSQDQVNAIMNAITSMILANKGIDPETPIALSAA